MNFQSQNYFHTLEFRGSCNTLLTIHISVISMRKLKTGRSFIGEGTLIREQGPVYKKRIQCSFNVKLYFFHFIFCLVVYKFDYDFFFISMLIWSYKKDIFFIYIYIVYIIFI